MSPGDVCLLSRTGKPTELCVVVKPAGKAFVVELSDGSQEPAPVDRLQKSPFQFAFGGKYKQPT